MLTVKNALTLSIVSTKITINNYQLYQQPQLLIVLQGVPLQRSLREYALPETPISRPQGKLLSICLVPLQRYLPEYALPETPVSRP